MKTIKETVKVNIEITKEDIIFGHYIFYDHLSSKLRDLEAVQGIVGKDLRNKFYNSYSSNKYNVERLHGLRCIDINKPMKDGVKASLELVFDKR